MDLLANLAVEDPFPFLTWLRDNDPLHRTPDGVVFVSRYADVQQVLRGSGSDFLGPAPMADRMPYRFQRRLLRSLALSNPPEHTRSRRAVTRHFTARRVDALLPRMEHITDRLLDDVHERLDRAEPVNLHTALAVPLPLAVMSELLDVPEADRPEIAALVTAIVPVVASHAASTEELEAAERAGDRVEEYFTDLIERRRAAPEDDLISALTTSLADTDEVLTSVWGMWVAGFETTATVINHGVLSVVGNPDELRWLRGGHDEAMRFAEEVLRHQSVVVFTTVGRTATRDVRLSSGTVTEGTVVRVMPAAANRDPAAFTEPDLFDPSRQGPGMLTLGHGIHHCLGAHLARTEVAVALARLHARFPELKLAGAPVHRPNPALRMIEQLMVTL
jgi:cytochrome P450 family 114